MNQLKFQRYFYCLFTPIHDRYHSVKTHQATIHIADYPLLYGSDIDFILYLRWIRVANQYFHHPKVHFRHLFSPPFGERTEIKPPLYLRHSVSFICLFVTLFYIGTSFGIYLTENKNKKKGERYDI